MSELSGGDIPDFPEGDTPEGISVPQPETDIVRRQYVEPEPALGSYDEPIVAGRERSVRGASAADAERPEEESPEPLAVQPAETEPAADTPPEEPVPAAGDVGSPPPPTEHARVTSESPEGFGIQRFMGEIPTPQQVKETAALFDAGTIAAVKQNGRYVDILPFDEKFARLILQREVPGHGSIRIGVDLEEASGVRISDSGVIIPEEPTAPPGDPRRIQAFFARSDGTKVGYAYFKDADGNVRRRECDLEIFAGLPKDGSMPDRMVYRMLKQRSDEGEAARQEMERALGIEYPLVGTAEMKYVLGETAAAEPSQTYLMRLRNIAVRRRMSRPAELEDGRLAGGRFIAAVNGFLRDQGYDPASRQATSVKISVIGSVPTAGPNEESDNTVMQVRAGKRRDTNGIKDQFVEILADRFGPLSHLAEQTHVTEALQRHGVDLSGQGRVATALTYTLNQGRLRSTLTEALFPLGASHGLLLVPRQTTFADTLEAREIRNFLRKPSI